jgi:hypothetical protein
MEANAIAASFDAMAGALDYGKLKQLDLPKEQFKNWRELAERDQGRRA